MSEGTAAWGRMQGEPEIAYNAFMLYAQTAPPRASVERFGASFNQPAWQMQLWAHVWQWRRRVEAFEVYYQAERAKTHQALIEEPQASVDGKQREMLAMAHEFATHEMAKLLVQSKKSAYPLVKARELAMIMKRSIELQRLVRGQGAPAEISDPTWGENLSDEKLAQLDALLQEGAGRLPPDIK